MVPAFEELNSNKHKDAEKLCNSMSGVNSEERGEQFPYNSGTWTEFQNTERDGASVFQAQVKGIRGLKELAVLEGLHVMCYYWSVKSMEESWERSWMLGESIWYSSERDGESEI